MWNGSNEVASVAANGKILAGNPKGKVLDFISKYLDDIANGINKYYYIGRG